MPRFEIEGYPIQVAYGYDFPTPGVFLSVVDKRLKYDASASDEVNAITEQIGVYNRIQQSTRNHERSRLESPERAGASEASGASGGDSSLRSE